MENKKMKLNQPRQIRFTDGVNVNIGGPLRTLKLKDGWYVVGEGFIIPCRDKEDAENELAAWRR